MQRTQWSMQEPTPTKTAGATERWLSGQLQQI